MTCLINKKCPAPRDEMRGFLLPLTGPRVLLKREARENVTRAAGAAAVRVAVAVVDKAEAAAAARTAGAQPTVGVSTDER